MFVRCKQGAPFSGIQVELFAIKVFCWFGSSLVRVTILHFGDEVPKNPGGLQTMATYGKIDSYEDDEDWCQYVERLEAYFEANDIDASEKQRAILLSVCGGKMYKLIRDLVAPALPKEKTYKEITDLVKAHKNPVPSAILQRFRFHSPMRQAGESVAAFVAELRHLTEHCKFHAGELSERLRDQLVVGVNDEAIHRRLFAEPDCLTFDRALELALIVETAAANAKDLQKAIPALASAEAGVNGVKTSAPGKEASAQPRCHRCQRGRHDPNQCHFKEAECFKCGQIGHIAPVCKAQRKSKLAGHPPGKGTLSQHKQDPQGAHQLGVAEESVEYSMFHCQLPRSAAYKTWLQVNGVETEMEIDTGASLSIVNDKTYAQLAKGTSPLVLQNTNLTLRTFSGELLKPMVVAKVTVKGKDGQPETLPLVVISGNQPSLIGRNWLENLKLDWGSVHKLALLSQLEALLAGFGCLFKDELGSMKGVKAHIQMDPLAKPVKLRARAVPYGLKDAVDKALDKLVQKGTIEPVQHSTWATPIVPVVKSDKSVRICGDYKLTVNKASNLAQYPLPRIDELFMKLAGGKSFTELDLSQAYEQMELDEASQEVVTITTHRGLFKYMRLPYGVSSAPAIFQRAIEELLQGIPNVGVFLDNILITGASDDDHLKNLRTVLERLEKANLGLKQAKCHFMKPRLCTLGHQVDAEGFRPMPAKVQAVQDAPAPMDVMQLKAYLGLLNFSAKYMPNLATVLAPLHELLHKDVEWHWDKEQEVAFQRLKGLLQSADVLVHYNPTKPLVVACDASPYGLGAVLAHVMPDGSERPVSFASRTLTPAEKNYSQLDREALAVVFATKKFHLFLYGKRFTLYTDHKPLLGIFGPSRGVPEITSPRRQRWILTMATYEFDLKHRPGGLNGKC